MKIINNVDDFKSLKSIDLEDIKTTKINDLKRKDEAKTRIMKYIFRLIFCLILFLEVCILILLMIMFLTSYIHLLAFE